jgi:hypothetical protein
MAIQLYDDQQVALDWLLAHQRGVLGDEYGIGKSYPTITAATCVWGRKLVVTQAYLIPQTVQMILDVNPYAEITPVDGETPAAKKFQLGLKSEWTIVSYNLLAMPAYQPLIEALIRNVQVVWFDEAHRLRTRTNAWTKFAWKVLHPGRFKGRVWMTTGTPQKRDGGDWYPYLKLCDPQVWSSYWRFCETYCHMEYTPWATEPRGIKSPELFAEAIKPYVLARSWADIGRSIPDYVPKNVWIDPPPMIKQLHAQAKKEWRVTYPDYEKLLLSAGAVIAELRQLTGDPPTPTSPKVQMAASIIEDEASDEQAIVWTWHRRTARRAYRELQARFPRRPVFMATGETPASERAHQVEQFKGTKNGLLVANIAALGLGENLQTGHVAVLIEECELETDNEQAIARQRRTGQLHPVRLFDVHLKNTVDGSVHKAAERRFTDAQSTNRALRFIVDDLLASP